MRADICSKHRNEIYGIAAVGILVVHSITFQTWTENLSFLNKLFTYGGLGVPMFAFLSGIGIYCSLQFNEAKTYLKNRFRRTFCPYLIIAGLFYGYLYFIRSQRPVMFLYEVSTLSFWVEHRNAWYIAMLVPVYTLAPVYDCWLKRGHRGHKTILTCACIFIVSNVLSYFAPFIYIHLSLVLRTLFVLLVGYYFGEKVQQKKDFSVMWITVPVLLYAAQAIYTRTACAGGAYEVPIRDVTFALCGMSLDLLVSFALEKIGSKNIFSKIFSQLGSVSLESYLWNTYLSMVLRMMGNSNDYFSNGYNGILFYVIIVCIGGITLSFIGANIYSRIIASQILQKSSEGH